MRQLQTFAYAHDIFNFGVQYLHLTLTQKSLDQLFQKRP